MTKLMQWLLVLFLYGGLYCAALSDSLPMKLNKDARYGVLVSPIILVLSFGIYSVITIMYRVATFNDCEEAAMELRGEIEEAKKDLSSKGMKFD